MAASHHVPFTGIWLDARPDMLRGRVAARSGGPSDADVGVLDRQLEKNTGDIGWCNLDAGEDISRLVETILARVK